MLDIAISNIGQLPSGCRMDLCHRFPYGIQLYAHYFFFRGRSKHSWKEPAVDTASALFLIKVLREWPIC